MDHKKCWWFQYLEVHISKYVPDVEHEEPDT